ncbi:shematrin-like protein 2 [Anthonomus grandis grandis]|uniref:shematrin-like protein 2 n=1 Tax=Anthonomus grandis grandis TaxID=2921223 RepID=UPI0021652506|nr:shematrin-like protein 2 [Anthonomus grandis grandis]
MHQAVAFLLVVVFSVCCNADPYSYNSYYSPYKNTYFKNGYSDYSDGYYDSGYSPYGYQKQYYPSAGYIDPIGGITKTISSSSLHQTHPSSYGGYHGYVGGYGAGYGGAYSGYGGYGGSYGGYSPKYGSTYGSSHYYK